MKKSTRLKISWFCFFAFMVYIVILFYFVFFSERYGRIEGYVEYQYNLELFKEIKRFMAHKDKMSWEAWGTNLLGNVFIFIPIGILVPMFVSKKINLIKCTILSFFCSLVIEATQFVCRCGVFDVDDLFLNTVGGLVGYLIFKFARRIYRWQYKKSLQKRMRLRRKE